MCKILYNKGAPILFRFYIENILTLPFPDNDFNITKLKELS